MAKFTVRVELYGDPSGEDYRSLHAAMLEKHYFRLITGSSGEEYWMPHAEYDKEARKTVNEIRDEAHRIASNVYNAKEGCCVLVTESAGRAWKNLKT